MRTRWVSGSRGVLVVGRDMAIGERASVAGGPRCQPRRSVWDVKDRWETAGWCGRRRGSGSDLGLEDELGMGEGLYRLVSDACDDASLQGAEATLDLALGLRARCDEVADAQGDQGSLELALGIASLGRGLVAEEGQAIGVEGHAKAHAEEDGAEEGLLSRDDSVGRQVIAKQMFPQAEE